MNDLFLEYLESIEINREGYQFYSLIMAAMRQADTNNLNMLRAMWPNVFDELQARYNAPGGALTQDEYDWLVKSKRVNA